MKQSDAEMDCDIILFDTKRVFVKEAETNIRGGIGIALLKKLAKISEWEGKPPPELGKTYRRWGYRIKVSFKFRGEDHVVEFYTVRDYLHPEPAIRRINGLIKDAGFQYHRPSGTGYLAYVVLPKGEAEKLVKERGWKLYLP